VAFTSWGSLYALCALRYAFFDPLHLAPNTLRLVCSMRVLEKESYEWQTLRVREDGKIKVK